MKLVFALVCLSLSTAASAGEANTATCSCKCAMNWLSSSVTVKPEHVGLPETADKIEVEGRSGLACRNYCEASETEKYGHPMYFGYTSGMCR